MCQVEDGHQRVLRLRRCRRFVAFPTRDASTDAPDRRERKGIEVIAESDPEMVRSRRACLTLEE
ncbi:MAG: hypothetical protein KatS3mg060_0398 [Dehalococcoidia bacterium]|nr:MAG: hypothetical protein KatS3mg060_0398 [Dehalococcoidia bacterium]